MSAGRESTVRSSQRAWVRVVVSMPEQLAQAARAAAEAIGSPSLSTFVASAVQEKLERDRLQVVLDDIFREQPMTDEEREWADRVLHRG